MVFLSAVGLIFFICFLLIVVRGAPYVPTHARDIESLFALYRFKPRDVLVDLGSGDGRVLRAAAKHGVMSVGFELNPFLVLITWLRLRRYRHLASVKMTDFWLTPLPDRTAVVFVFLAAPFMKKLDQHLQREVLRLGHDITLVSYGMKIADKTPTIQQHGYVLYTYKA